MFPQSDAALRSNHMIQGTDQNKHCHPILAVYEASMCINEQVALNFWYIGNLLFFLPLYTLGSTDSTDRSAG